MKRNKAAGSLFGLLAGHELLFMLTLLVLAGAVFLAWDAALTDLYRPADWDALLADEFHSEYYAQIRRVLKKEYAEHEVYPPMEDIFNALRYTAYADVKAVLLGQDPYHGPGQAQGLCFSVRPGVPLPPSLQNIFTELQNDMGLPAPHSGSLIPWAKEGVQHAVGMGWLEGSEGKINPTGLASRAQLAVLLDRMATPAMG